MRTGSRSPKKYGQVYLADPDIASFEVGLLDLKGGERVLEIGPGHGELTEFLLNAGATVTAVESDHLNAGYVESKFSSYVDDGKLTVVHQSILDFAPETYSSIIGNVPYHITSEILFHLYSFEFERCVLMVQKEFAARCLAMPGSKEYSRLSVNCFLRYEIHLAKDVPANAFHPVPAVDSSVMIIRKKGAFSLEAIESTDRVLNMAFSMRRKKIGTIFKEAPEKYKEMRPGDLSPDEFVELGHLLF